MAETAISDSVANALSGTTESNTDLVYPTIADTYYTDFYRLIHRLVQCALKPGGNELRVYQDADDTDLQYSVRAGKFFDGTTVRNYAGATAQALTDDATNYIYLTAAATLTKNTTGFPDAGTTPHIPLATIVTADGSYDYGDITHYTGRAVHNVCHGVSAADLQDRLPYLTLTAGAEAADKIQVTIQAVDSGDNNLAQRMLSRVWVAQTEYAAPDATGNTVAVDTGTPMQAVVANAHYLVESDASGTIVFGLTVSGAATRYVMAEIDGRVYSSGAITFAA